MMDMSVSGAWNKLLLIIGTSYSKSKLWFYFILFRIRNNLQDPEMTFLKMNITATKTKFLKDDTTFNAAIMMIGDEAGYIHKWDLSPIISELRSKGFKEV
jgi:hypothetical protein